MYALKTPTFFTRPALFIFYLYFVDISFLLKGFEGGKQGVKGMTEVRMVEETEEGGDHQRGRWVGFGFLYMYKISEY